MMKRERYLKIAVWGLCVLLVILAVVSIIILRQVDRRRPTGQAVFSNLRMYLDGVTLSLPGGRFAVRLKGLSVRSLLSGVENQTLAFAGPAEVAAGAQNRPMNVSGTISGNMKTGAVSIGKTTVTVKDLGTAEITGNLENWGKDGATVNAVVRGLSVKNLSKFLALAVPADGEAGGTLVFHFGGKEKVNRLDFDLAISRLHTENTPLFHGNLKGMYDLAGKKASVGGALESPQKERIAFTADITGDDFTVKFDSEGLTVETVLQFLPENLRKKLGGAQGKGTVSLKDFLLEKKGSGYACAGNVDLNAPELKLANVPLRDVNFTMKRGVDDTCRGDYTFTLCGGKGKGRISVSHLSGFPEVNTSFDAVGIDLASFSRALNDQVLVTGILDVEGSCVTDKDRQEIVLTFRTREKRGLKQTLNFAAVKAIAALGGGTVGQIGRSDFNYQKLAGRLTLRNGYFTVEGLAGEQGDNQYLLKAPLFGQGINVLVHSRTNTIRFEDFKKRIANALQSAA